MIDLSAPCEYLRNKPGSDGYVRVKGLDGRRTTGHRRAWEEANGPLPDDWIVQHECHLADPDCLPETCKHKACVQLKHLVAHPRGEVRIPGIPEEPNLKTHCVHGHEYTEKNSYYLPGTNSKICRMCAFLRHQEQLRKKKLIEYGLEES